MHLSCVLGIYVSTYVSQMLLLKLFGGLPEEDWTVFSLLCLCTSENEELYASLTCVRYLLVLTYVSQMLPS